MRRRQGFEQAQSPRIGGSQLQVEAVTAAGSLRCTLDGSVQGPIYWMVRVTSSCFDRARQLRLQVETAGVYIRYVSVVVVKAGC